MLPTTRLLHPLGERLVIAKDTTLASAAGLGETEVDSNEGDDGEEENDLAREAPSLALGLRVDGGDHRRHRDFGGVVFIV